MLTIFLNIDGFKSFFWFKKIIQIKHFFQDSDGNNADDDSVNSFISSSINLNSGSHIDEIPTRDLGPERPGHLNYSQVSHLFVCFILTHFFCILLQVNLHIVQPNQVK